MSVAPTVTADFPGDTASFESLLARFPLQCCELASKGDGVVGYREAGASTRALPVVLLHGIGSGVASWVQQFDALGAQRRVLAWDAPGYGTSTPVSVASPFADDYVVVLKNWLDAVGIERCVLVGHSLGAIIAGGFAAAHQGYVAGLLLLSPAGGYGTASEALRAAKRDQRLAMLDELGPQRLAEQRSANMLSAHADANARAWVRWNMARIVPQGYAQATHLLANANLAGDLAHCASRAAFPTAVAVGAEDTITPPDACRLLADAARTTLQIVPRAGHAGYIEQAAAYTTIIDTFCRVAEDTHGAAV